MAMRMPKFDKKTWCHIGAGTVAVILLSIAVVQCSDKEDARNHYAAAADLVRDLTVEKDSLGQSPSDHNCHPRTGQQSVTGFCLCLRGFHRGSE